MPIKQRKWLFLLMYVLTLLSQLYLIQQPFLANDSSKDQFIKLLVSKLERYGILAMLTLTL